jgi:hypothetical protein
MTTIECWLMLLEIQRIGFGLVRMRSTRDSSRSAERVEIPASLFFHETARQQARDKPDSRKQK